MRTDQPADKGGWRLALRRHAGPDLRRSCTAATSPTIVDSQLPAVTHMPLASPGAPHARRACAQVREPHEEGRGGRGDAARRRRRPVAQGRRADLARAGRRGSGGCAGPSSRPCSVRPVSWGSAGSTSVPAGSMLPARQLTQGAVCSSPCQGVHRQADVLRGAQSCRGTCATRWCPGTMPPTTTCRPTPRTRAARAAACSRRPTTWVRDPTLPIPLHLPNTGRPPASNARASPPPPARSRQAACDTHTPEHGTHMHARAAQARLWL